MEQEEAGRWLAQARWDLKAAADSAAAGNYEWACFQSQQAAVRAFWSVLASAGVEPDSPNSVRRLVRQCEPLDPGFSHIESAAELDLFFATTRDPDALAGDIPHEYFSADHAKRCASLASAAVEHVEGWVLYRKAQ